MNLFRRRKQPTQPPPRPQTHAGDPTRLTLRYDGSVGEAYAWLQPYGYQLDAWLTEPDQPLTLQFRGPGDHLILARVGDTLVARGDVVRVEARGR